MNPSHFLAEHVELIKDLSQATQQARDRSFLDRIRRSWGMPIGSIVKHGCDTAIFTIGVTNIYVSESNAKFRRIWLKCAIFEHES